jgi:hypothetical protein
VRERACARVRAHARERHRSVAVLASAQRWSSGTPTSTRSDCQRRPLLDPYRRLYRRLQVVYREKTPALHSPPPLSQKHTRAPARGDGAGPGWGTCCRTSPAAHTERHQSESLHPSHFIRVASSESLHPSRFIRVASYCTRPRHAGIAGARAAAGGQVLAGSW